MQKAFPGVSVIVHNRKFVPEKGKSGQKTSALGGEWGLGALERALLWKSPLR